MVTIPLLNGSHGECVVRKRKILLPLICKSLITPFREDDATIYEAVLFKNMLHDVVVAMRIYANVVCKDRAMTHDLIEDSMGIWETCYAMNDRIGTHTKLISIAIKPMPVLYC